MPDKDGFNVCKEIRKFSSVPIMILSAINKPGLIEQALDAGADEYLRKPVPTNILIARINTLVRRARAEREIANQTEMRKQEFEPQT